MSIDKNTYDMLRKSTIRITHYINDKIKVNNGTGFICKNPSNGKEYVITNHHVVNTKKEEYKELFPNQQLSHKFMFSIYTKNESMNIPIETPEWIEHPTCDLAALNIKELKSEIDKKNLNLDYCCIDKIADEKYLKTINCGEDIIIPCHVVSELMSHELSEIMGRELSELDIKFPMVLTILFGKTAMALWYNSHKSTVFIADCIASPGSSGSPVYHFNKSSERITLIGVVYKSHFYHKFLMKKELKEIKTEMDQSEQIEEWSEIVDYKTQIYTRPSYCINSEVLLEWFSSEDF